MARYLKNPDLTRSGKLAARLPVVPSSAYGDAPVDGLIRFNQDTSRIEFYYNGAWSSIAKIGSVQLKVDSFSGDGITQTFLMSQAESDPTAIAVFIGGVYQQPIANGVGGINPNSYSVDGSDVITFTYPPPEYTGTSPTQIIVIHNINSTNVPA